MTLRLGKPGAIEPTSVDKMPKGYFLGIDPAFGESFPAYAYYPEDYPSPLMRRLGYTRHPAHCHHDRKKLMLGSSQWRCADCGTELR